MARIAGIDIPKQKRGVIALTYIFGIGKSRAQEILATAKVDESKKVSDWDDDEMRSYYSRVCEDNDLRLHEFAVEHPAAAAQC